MALPLLVRSGGGAALRQLGQRRPALTQRLYRVPFRCMAAKGGKGKDKEESECTVLG